jgi:hypothetical protein
MIEEKKEEEIRDESGRRKLSVYNSTKSNLPFLLSLTVY